PPLIDLSYSVKARKPFLYSPAGGAGCGVKLPNNSDPLSTKPLPFRSNTNHASSDSAVVQESFSLKPSLSKSNSTPVSLPERLKPFPATSITIGLPQPLPVWASQTHWQVFSSHR